MMKQRIIFIALLFVAVVQTSCSVTQEVTNEAVVVQLSVEERLRAIPEVKQITKMTSTDHYKENYELWFEQHTDPKDLSSPTFNQRVLVAHYDQNAPVVVELQGYSIYSAKSGELSTTLKSNQITIEHRYFANSMPEVMDWTTLTVANAAYDQHLIIQAIKKALYSSNKFISTGISKGGQTTMIHRSIYPNDVDGSVCYVAPLNFEREDPRIYEFLKTVGTAEQRKQVEEFQILCFERKAKLLPLLNTLAIKNGWEWDVDLNHAFELYVLEYSFAFWQWGAYEFDQIPNETASDREVLNHVLNVSGVSFFEKKGVEGQRSFFWAALTEMGIYGYENEPFKEYLSQKSTYLFDFAFPKNIHGKFSPEAMISVNDFIQNDAKNMIFIYGELDTWSATAVQLSESAKSRGLRKFVSKGGHHATRIKSFPGNEKREIVDIIESWLVE